MKGKMELDDTDATAFDVGIKLFGEVMLKNRDNEIFKKFKPHLTAFMKELKNS